MNKTDQTRDAGQTARRTFLKGAAVTTVTVGSGALAANAVAEQVAPKAPETGQGYQETAHVRDYYRLARF